MSKSSSTNLKRAAITRDAQTGAYISKGTLADPAVSAVVKDLRRKVSSTSEEAQKFLQAVGTVTKSGALQKRFGGR